MELFGRIESAFDRKHSGMNILKTRNSQNSFLFQFSNKNCIQNKYDKLSLLDQSIRRIGFWMRYERFVKPTSHFYSCLVRIFFFFRKTKQKPGEIFFSVSMNWNENIHLLFFKWCKCEYCVNADGYPNCLILTNAFNMLLCFMFVHFCFLYIIYVYLVCFIKVGHMQKLVQIRCKSDWDSRNRIKELHGFV